MKTYVVDYETYYDKECSITTLGSRAYFSHERFDAYMVAIDGPDWQFVGHPKDAPWEKMIGSDTQWLSHNASFDECLHWFLIERGILPPNALPAKWDCTADMVAYLGIPRSLKDSCKAVLDISLSKATRDDMKGKRWEEMPDDFKQEVTDYALHDCIYARLLWEKCEKYWPDHERRLSRQTRRLGWGGVPVDLEKLERDIVMLEAAIVEAYDRIPWSRNIPVGKKDPEKALSTNSLARYCREAGVEPPPSTSVDSEECAAWLKQHEGKPCADWVLGMQDLRSANALLEKLYAIRTRTFDGWMDFNLKYAGAHTLRWSGGGGVNMQNLPRGRMFGVDLRSTFRAPEGKTFVMCDLSQIEPRSLHCLAGDQAFIDRLRKNPTADLYDIQARLWGMYNEEAPLKEGNPKVRQDVKTLNIGLGYKMGAGRFAAQTGFPIEEALYWVNFYQSVNPLICGLWQHLMETFFDAIHSESKTFEMVLPLRTMRYRSCSNAKGNTARINKNGKFIEQRIWAGILVENLVQAFARDIFATKLLEIEEAGYQILWHIHDEVVVLVDEDKAEEAKAHIEEIMRRDVQWCVEAGLDLPLNAEAEISKFFKK